MRIVLTLSEILDRCNDWDSFCENEGYSVYAVKEGGGDLVVSLSEKKAKEYGIIKK